MLRAKPKPHSKPTQKNNQIISLSLVLKKTFNRRLKWKRIRSPRTYVKHNCLLNIELNWIQVFPFNCFWLNSIFSNKCHLWSQPFQIIIRSWFAFSAIGLNLWTGDPSGESLQWPFADRVIAYPTKRSESEMANTCDGFLIIDFWVSLFRLIRIAHKRLSWVRMEFSVNVQWLLCERSPIVWCGALTPTPEPSPGRAFETMRSNGIN